MEFITEGNIIYSIRYVGNNRIQEFYGYVEPPAETPAPTPDPTTEERISLLESDNATLMLTMAETQIKQQEMDQTIADLMLMVAGGQPSV